MEPFRPKEVVMDLGSHLERRLFFFCQREAVEGQLSADERVEREEATVWVSGLDRSESCEAGLSPSQQGEKDS
jgi:hypothetical protein